MDDLRDYRFYSEDMLHPSEVAVEYIWKAFSECYFDTDTASLWKELFGIAKAKKHRFISDSPSARKEFASNMLKKIAVLRDKYHGLDLQEEISYFSGIV